MCNLHTRVAILAIVALGACTSGGEGAVDGTYELAALESMDGCGYGWSAADFTERQWVVQSITMGEEEGIRVEGPIASASLKRVDATHFSTTEPMIAQYQPFLMPGDVEPLDCVVEQQATARVVHTGSDIELEETRSERAIAGTECQLAVMEGAVGNPLPCTTTMTLTLRRID